MPHGTFYGNFMITLIIGTNINFSVDRYGSNSFFAVQIVDLVLAKMIMLVVWQNDIEKQEEISE